MNDPVDPEWKVVRYKDPRSRRVVDSLSERSLSAPGRQFATLDLNRAGMREVHRGQARPEPVLEADVQHVNAHVEHDDEAAHNDIEHHEMSDDEPVQTSNATPVAEAALYDFIDDE